MDSKQEMTMIRSFVKSALQERGLDFKKHISPKEAQTEADNINQKVPGLNLTSYELTIIHRKLMHELIDEYYIKVDEQILKSKESG